MLSGGVGLSFQYIQELQLSTTSLLTPVVWLVAGETTPRVQNDQANVGIERWSSSGVLIAANAYARRSTGIVTTDPRPGGTIDRPLFVDAAETAQGVEVSARRLSGRFTGSVAYSFARATRTAQGLSYDAPGDRRHALDATALVKLRGFRFGTGLSAMSGLPYSRARYGQIIADSTRPGSFTWRDIVVLGAPNAQRFPGSASLDVMADWTHTMWSATLTVFIQAPNALGRRNLTAYYATDTCAQQVHSFGQTGACINGDLLYSVVPRQRPSVGVRIAF